MALPSRKIKCASHYREALKSSQQVVWVSQVRFQILLAWLICNKKLINRNQDNIFGGGESDIFPPKSICHCVFFSFKSLHWWFVVWWSAGFTQLNSWHTITQLPDLLPPDLPTFPSAKWNYSVRVPSPHPRLPSQTSWRLMRPLFENPAFVFYQNLPSYCFMFSLHSSVALVFMQLSPSGPQRL